MIAVVVRTMHHAPEALAALREEMKHQGERTDLDDNVIEVMAHSRSRMRGAMPGVMMIAVELLDALVVEPVA